jgi:alcohol dehydrogenase
MTTTDHPDLGLAVSATRADTMKAVVYQGPGRLPLWTDVPVPVLQDSADAIVRVDATTICGTDLHILKGDIPEVTLGRILGHEAVGTVEQVGSGVKGLSPGDRVLVSCITACGRCRYCREGQFGQCLGGGGWILGHLIDGTQAELVRIPFAESSLHLIPEGVSDEEALMLSDILPTSYEVGVLNGCVRPGDTVVVVGAGPIGLAAVLTARLFSPAQIIVIDPNKARTDDSFDFGATAGIRADHDPVECVRAVTDGLGADVVIEAVGRPDTFELCAELVRPGGHVANIGVHGQPATLHLESLWAKDLTITTGLVDTSSTPTLLRMLAAGQLTTSDFITHRFELSQFLEAYDVFAHAQDSGALKVAVFRHG